MDCQANSLRREMKEKGALGYYSIESRPKIVQSSGVVLVKDEEFLLK